MVPKEKRITTDDNNDSSTALTRLYQVAERKLKLMNEETFFRYGVKE